MKAFEKLKSLDQIVAPKAKKLKVQPSVIKSMYSDQQKFDLLWNQITSKCNKLTYRMDTYVMGYMLDLQTFKTYCLSNYDLKLTESMIETYNSYCKDYIEMTLDVIYKNEAFLIDHPYLKVNGEVKNDLSFSERLKSNQFVSRCRKLNIDLESKVLVVNGKNDLEELDDFIKSQLTEMQNAYLHNTWWKDKQNRWNSIVDLYVPFRMYYEKKTQLSITMVVGNFKPKDNIKNKLDNIEEFWNQYKTESIKKPGIWALRDIKEFQLGTTIESYKEAFFHFKTKVDKLVEKL
jgi:hypothetical protein